MDAPGLDPEEHHAALRGLERIHRLSACGPGIWRHLQALARELQRPLRCLDLASGGGELAFDLERRARRAGLTLAITGVDKSETATGFAHERARQRGSNVEFRTGDAFELLSEERVDVAWTSLFLHHLDAAPAQRLLGAMARCARELVLVNDLVRSSPGWILAWAGTRLLTRSEIVHVDGTRSVEGAWTPGEARELARAAGWPQPRLERSFPCRYMLSSRLAGAGAKA